MVSISVYDMNEDVLRGVFFCGQSFPTLDRMLFAVRVSSVCKAWRSLALDTSLLWTAVVRYRDRRHSHGILSEYLLRSRDRKLDILICGHPDYLNLMVDEFDVLHGVMRTLVHHRHRWNTLVLKSGAIAGLEGGTMEIRGTSSLKELLISCETPHVGLSAFFHPTFSAPMLRSLRLDASACLGQEDTLCTCFPTLEEITLNGQCTGIELEVPGGLIRSLAALQNLRRAKINAYSLPHGTVHGMELPRFRVLEELELGGLSVASIRGLLCTFDAPKLKLLFIRSGRSMFLDDEPDPSPFNPIPPIPLHRARFPELSTVRIDSCCSFRRHNPPRIESYGFRVVQLVRTDHCARAVLQSAARRLFRSSPRGAASGATADIADRLRSIRVRDRPRGQIEDSLASILISQASFLLTAEPRSLSHNEHIQRQLTSLHVQTTQLLSPKKRAWFNWAVGQFSWTPYDELDNELAEDELPVLELEFEV